VLVSKIGEHEPEVAARLGLPAISVLVNRTLARDWRMIPLPWKPAISERASLPSSESLVGQSFLVLHPGARLRVDLPYADEEVERHTLFISRFR